MAGTQVEDLAIGTGGSGVVVITDARVLQNIISAILGEIRQGTADGADNSRLDLSGGGANATSRGARVLLGGNEHASIPGQVVIQAGNVAAAFIEFYTEDTARMRIEDGVVMIGTSSPGSATAGGLRANGTNDFGDTRFTSNDVRMGSLPTTDPGIPGRLWRDGTTIKVSV